MPTAARQVRNVEEVYAAMMLVYGDDSADETKQRVCAIGVVFGDDSLWSDLEGKWKSRLPGIPFHANDCESDWGDFREFPHEANKALYRDLTTMLAHSQLSGVAIAIDLISQAKVFPESPLDFSYYKAFNQILDGIAQTAGALHEIAKFKFDISTENEHSAGKLYEVFKQTAPGMEQILFHEIAFGPARSDTRLQVADLLAYEGMKAVDHAIGPVKRRRASWEALRETGRFETICYGEEWFADLKRNYSTMEQMVGFTQSDYVNWLKERKREHNMSNYLTFLSWFDKNRKTESN